MARKVKQYLSSLDVDTDEEKFQMMSLQWEPAYGTCKYKVSLNVKKNRIGIYFSRVKLKSHEN